MQEWWQVCIPHLAQACIILDHSIVNFKHGYKNFWQFLRGRTLPLSLSWVGLYYRGSDVMWLPKGPAASVLLAGTFTLESWATTQEAQLPGCCPGEAMGHLPGLQSCCTQSSSYPCPVKNHVGSGSFSWSWFQLSAISDTVEQRRAMPFPNSWLAAQQSGCCLCY